MGDLSYQADKWNGQTDDGEFSITLSCTGGLCPLQGFTPHRLVTERKYYYSGSTRVAMSVNGVIKYLFGDHLGSTSVIAKPNGTVETERGYKPWGEQRYGSAGVTSFGFTGQRDSSVAGGIMYYGARFYDNALGRFLSADTVVPNPGNPLDFDRYAYVLNSPIIYNDPTGHEATCSIYLDGQCAKYTDNRQAPRDIDALTDAGQKAYEYYVWARNHESWWNNYQVGTLTAKQFLGIFILYEAGIDRDIKLQYIKDAVGAQLFMKTTDIGGNSPYCHGGICDNAIFNFIASYQGYEKYGLDSLLVERFSDLDPSPNLAIGEKIEDLANKASQIGDEILLGRSKYANADRNTAPYDWGNDMSQEHQPFRVFTVNDDLLYQWP